MALQAAHSQLPMNYRSPWESLAKAALQPRYSDIVIAEQRKELRTQESIRSTTIHVPRRRCRCGEKRHDLPSIALLRSEKSTLLLSLIHI